MKECILLFNFKQVKARKLATQLMMLKFKVKIVKEEDWNQKIGYLCGNLEQSIDESSEKQRETGSLDNPMLVMAGVDGNRLNHVLTAIKKAGIGKLPYKAVVTETNQHWLPADLLKELKQEHEQVTSPQKQQPPVYLHEQ